MRSTHAALRVLLSDIFDLVDFLRCVYTGNMESWSCRFHKRKFKVFNLSRILASSGTYNAQRFLDARGIVGQILHFCHNLVEMATTECYLFSNFNVSKHVRLFFFWYTVTIACSKDARFQKFISKRGLSCTSLVTAETKEDSIRY